MSRGTNHLNLYHTTLTRSGQRTKLSCVRYPVLDKVMIIASTLTMTLTLDYDGSLLDPVSGYYCSKALFEGVTEIPTSALFFTHGCTASDRRSQTSCQEGFLVNSQITAVFWVSMSSSFLLTRLPCTQGSTIKVTARATLKVRLVRR